MIRGHSYALPVSTSFIGVSDDEVASGITGLYEFTSIEGHHVYLHDTDLVAVTYEPGPVPKLTTTFRWVRKWVPELLGTTPLVVIAFEKVRIIAWEEDDEAVAAVHTNPEAAAAAGQTTLFDWDGDRTFSLSSFTFGLTFTADTAEVTFQPDLV